MKIVITSTGESMDSKIDPRFGRSGKFIVFDTLSRNVETADNTQNLNLPQGAGIQTAENISRFDPDFVITGHCGPKAFRILQAVGIAVLLLDKDCSVSEAVKMFESNELKPASGPDVEGHWI